MTLIGWSANGRTNESGCVGSPVIFHWFHMPPPVQVPSNSKLWEYAVRSASVGDANPKATKQNSATKKVRMEANEAEFSSSLLGQHDTQLAPSEKLGAVLADLDNIGASIIQRTGEMVAHAVACEPVSARIPC